MRTPSIQQQAGVSLSAFIAILVVLGVFATFAMKVIPMYMEFNGVKQAMDAVAKEEFEDKGALKESLHKRFSTNYVETVTKDDITIRSKDNGYEVNVDYYSEKPLFSNLSITAHFEYTVVTQ